MASDISIVTICARCAEIEGAKEQVRAAEREAKHWRDTAHRVLGRLSRLAAQRPRRHGTFERLLFGAGWRMEERTRNAQVEVEAHVANAILRDMLRMDMQKHHADKIADQMIEQESPRG